MSTTRRDAMKNSVAPGGVMAPGVVRAPGLSGQEVGPFHGGHGEALSHGLRPRPLAPTHLDTRDWWFSDAVPDERKQNPRFPLPAD
jgi:hypothetical protein